MKRFIKWLLILIIFTFYIIGCNTNTSNTSIENTLSERNLKWVEDLDVLLINLPKYHYNLFTQITKEEFENEINKLKKAVPQIEDYEIIVEIMKIIAMVGDAHTRLSGKFHYYPIGTYWFSDGLFVDQIDKEYEEMLGLKLIKVGEIPIKELMTMVKPLIPHENEVQILNVSPYCFTVQEILLALGIFPDIKTPAYFIFEDNNGNSIKLDNIKPNQSWSNTPWVSIEDKMDKLPLYLQNWETSYWYKYIEDEKAIYCCYNFCENMSNKSFNQFTEEMIKFMNENQVDKFIFDIRNNQGGNSSIANPLIEKIKNNPIINQEGHLFVIIGRRTFSSAILNANSFKIHTNALFFGEPTGGKPNHFGEVKLFQLPNSKIRIHYSTKYFKWMDIDIDSFYPDVDIRMSSKDYFEGRDPVLEEILKYNDN